MSITNVGKPTAGAIQNAEISSTAEAKKTAKKLPPGRPAGPATSAELASGGSKTEISDRGRDIAKTKAAATSAPDVRESKIAELKARIDAGKYKVDADKVADRMVSDHLEMSGMS